MRGKKQNDGSMEQRVHWTEMVIYFQYLFYHRRGKAEGLLQEQTGWEDVASPQMTRRMEKYPEVACEW